MDEASRPFETMWTKDIDAWELRRCLRSGALMPVCRGDPPHALVIEDDGVPQTVAARMEAAGVPTAEQQ